ncbi:MAG TPA: hypothetical protein VMM15_07240 [Bradyrhizobium sp.]|nr:hypothetical protein [Bradyrhizobium sp.]
MSGIVVGACTLMACSSAERQAFFPPDKPEPRETAAVSAKMPGNYRALVAEQIRTYYRYRNLMRDAKITPPYERYGGLFRGGTMPAVCVALYRDNPFGILVRDTLVFAYEDGKMQNILPGTESCSDLSEFTELKRS